jgi:16S rRNA processing protein RimM
MDRLVPVGRIVKTHGVKGEVKLIPYFEPPELYERFQALHVKLESGQTTELRVQGVRCQKHFLILKLKDCESIDDAGKLLGREAEIPSRQLPTLPEDAFYWHDLKGLTVYDQTGKLLGRIEEIFPTGGNDVLVVRRGDEELLLPAIADVVTEVDLREGKMTVRSPEWLR